MYKRIVKFKDADKNMFNIEMNIKNGVLSMVGECGRGCGQIQECVNPANDAQEKLVDIWDRWHLNDMHAGTMQQENAVDTWIKSGNVYEYDYVVAHLKSVGLYVDHTRVPGYKYGTAWLRHELPADIENLLDTVCDHIEQLEVDEVRDCFLTMMNDDDIEVLLDNYHERVVALGLVLDLTDVDLDDVEHNGNDLSYGGYNYFVGDQDDAEQEAMEYLTDDPEMWQMEVEAGNTIDGLEEWAEQVINIDGVGSILNHWDGGQDDVEVNGTWYVVCRR